MRTRPSAGTERWRSSRPFYKRGPGTLYRKLKSIQFLLTRDRKEAARFLAARYPFDFPRWERVKLLQSFIRATNAMRGYHTLAEMLVVCDAIFRRAGQSEITVLEAGCGYGSTTVKLSLATQIVGGKLFVFDTFRGIPQNDEKHELLDGRPVIFRTGAFRGRLTGVKRRVDEYGALEVCTFHKGLFEQTMKDFRRPLDVVLLDVDLLASTRTCLEQLVPQLREDGVLFSQDGHLKATVELMSRDSFWRDEVGVEPPEILGLGEDKLLELRRVNQRA